MTPDLSKTDLDHLTAKYHEAAEQVDELQKQISIQREKANELELAITDKQNLMKTISLKIIKRTQKTN